MKHQIPDNYIVAPLPTVYYKARVICIYYHHDLQTTLRCLKTTVLFWHCCGILAAEGGLTHCFHIVPGRQLTAYQNSTVASQWLRLETLVSSPDSCTPWWGLLLAGSLDYFWLCSIGGPGCNLALGRPSIHGVHPTIMHTNLYGQEKEPGCRPVFPGMFHGSFCTLTN